MIRENLENLETDVWVHGRESTQGQEERMPSIHRPEREASEWSNPVNVLILHIKLQTEQRCISVVLATLCADFVTAALLAHFFCLLEWVWNHPGDTPLGVSVRMFPERFNQRGKTQPEHKKRHLLGWGPRLDKKRICVRRPCPLFYGLLRCGRVAALRSCCHWLRHAL